VVTFLHNRCQLLIDWEAKFAWCTLCRNLNKPSANIMANIKQLESKGITERGDCAKRMSLSVGKTDVILRKLKHRVYGADSRVRTYADDALSEMHVRKNMAGNSQAEDSQAKVQGAKPAVSDERLANSQWFSVSNNTVERFAVDGNRLIYSHDQHSRRIANFMTVCDISANALASDEFQALRRFLRRRRCRRTILVVAG
jgi:hypothetical protein